MNQTGNIPFKVVLLGDGGCGKTAWLHKLCGGEFEKRYLPTLGVNIKTLICKTKQGNNKFIVWDTAGQEKFSGLKSGYYLGADAAIIFYDMTSKFSFKNVNTWINELLSVAPLAKIIIVGNKCDLDEKKCITDLTATLSTKFPLVNISAKTNYNINQPFILIAKHVTKNHDLEFAGLEYVE